MAPPADQHYQSSSQCRDGHEHTPPTKASNLQKRRIQSFLDERLRDGNILALPPTHVPTVSGSRRRMSQKINGIMVPLKQN